MATFLSCFAILAFLLFVFFAFGLGVVALILPRDCAFNPLKAPWLLAPLIGYTVFASLGMTKITFLMPLQPVSTAALLLCVSISICWITRDRLIDCVRAVSLKQHLLLAAPAFAFAVYFAFLFHHAGFELLSGSGDEFNYCSNASHMLRYQNTGATEDLPLPRPDHWIYDCSTKFLCYWNGYRRGAEVLLASTIALTSLSAPAAFSALCGTLICALILALGAVSIDCLRLDYKRTLVLQLGCGGLFYLLLLQVQGSLANLCSIGCFVCGLAYLGMALSEKLRPGMTILAGIFLGGTVLFYSDVAAFELLIPVIVIVVSRIIQNTKSGIFILLKRLAILFTTCVLIATQGFLTIVPNFIYSLNGVRENHSASSTQPLTAALVHSPLAVDLGAASYYDDSSAEAAAGDALYMHADRLFGVAIILYSLALYGYLRLGRRCIALRTPFVLLLLMFCPLVLSHDYLRVARALGYSVPYLLIGLVLATQPARRRLLPIVSSIFLSAFIGMNIFAVGRTAAHVNRTTLQTDKLTKRLNPDAIEWRTLRAELFKYPQSPVLLSGFKDKPTPMWIVGGIEPHPNFLGESLTSTIYFKDSLVSGPDWVKLIQSRVSYSNHKQPLPALATWNWQHEYPRMLYASRLAIVPPGGCYPPEWKQWQDVLPAYRTRFTNICDVVYKDRLAILKDAAIGELLQDERGIFRILNGQWKPKLTEDGFSIYRMRVSFEGKCSNLSIGGLALEQTPTFVSEEEGLSSVEIPVSSMDFGKLVLIPNTKSVKLRLIDLREVDVDMRIACP